MSDDDVLDKSIKSVKEFLHFCERKGLDNLDPEIEDLYSRLKHSLWRYENYEKNGR